MDIGRIALFNVTGRRMDYMAQRQELIAQNVANADTPGWRSRDLVPFETASRFSPSLKPVQTNQAHAYGTVRGGDYANDRRAERWETTPTENGVSLEQEMVKASETRDGFMLAAGLYQRSVGMIRSVIGGR
jgi:flagellar basal-body rod protein FlgB